MSKSKTVRFTRNVNCNDDYTDTRPDKVVIPVDENFATRILQLAKTVERLGVYQIVDFDYTPNWKQSGVKEPDWTVDCVTIHVMDDCFNYTALIKHTNIELISERVYLADLRKRF